MDWDRELKAVIELQQKAYRLLMWMQNAMDTGWISPQSAHKNMSASEVTEAWLLEHYENVPVDARPDRSNNAEVQAFCNLFSSFLLNSFEIDENPGKRLYSPHAHCFCPMCSWLEDVSHLRPKKLKRADKAKARKLKLKALRQMCVDMDQDWEEKHLEQLLDDESIREDIAIVAHACELVKRSKGISEGPATLALWREFAWKKEGSSKKKFKFDHQLVLGARDIVQHVLRNMN